MDVSYAFFVSLTTGENIEESLKKFIDCALEYGLHHEPSSYHIDVLKKIGVFLNQKTANVLNVNASKRINESYSYTFKSIFETVFESHGHTLINTKGEEYKCSFHVEPLAMHLLLSMLFMIDKASEENDNIDYMMRNGITGLFHDIGKLVAKKMSENGKMKVSGFPAHGEIGSYMLIQLWNEELTEFFTKKQWEELCRVVATHMCGYHCEATCKKELDYFSEYKWSLLRIENTNVKNALYKLSFADSFSAIPETSRSFEKFYISRDYFKNEVVDKEFNVDDFMKTSRRTSGTLVYIIGHSGSGKTTIAKEIHDYLIGHEIPESMILNISRDEYIMKLTASKLGLEYTDTVEFYTETYKKYKELGKEMMEKVNTTIKNDIDTMLMKNGVVILDTLMNMFSYNEILPSSRIRRARIINVMIARNSKIDVETSRRRKIGTDEEVLEHQIRLIDKHEFYNPFHSGCKNGNYKHIASLASQNRFSDCEKIPQLATIVHTITWTLGHEIMLEQILTFSKMGEMTEEVDITKLHIHELVGYLVETLGYRGMLSWFKERFYLASPLSILKGTEYEETAVKIVYMDRNPNWKDTWHLETRGTIVYYVKGRWNVLSRRLARGMEVVSGYHLKKSESGDCETQDIASFKNIHDIDTGTMEVIRFMLSETKSDDDTIKGVLTSKADGSFCGVTLLIDEAREVVERWINEHGDDYSKIVLRIAHEMKLEYLPVIGTKGTFFSGESMWNYILTSLNMTYNKVPFVELTDIYEKEGSLISTMTTTMPLFLTRIDDFWRETQKILKQGPSMTLSFEVICANRRSVDGVHTELAVSYGYSTLRFLGASFNCGESMGVYKAHFQLPYSERIFDTPLYWYVKNPEQVSEMIAGISQMFRIDDSGKIMMTKDKYLSRFVPENIGRTKYIEIDAEGFVYYHSRKPSTSISHLNHQHLHYAKVKSTEYYDFHKLNPKKLKELNNLSSEAGIVFPIYGAILDFFSDIERKGMEYTEIVRKTLEESSTNIEHELVIALEEKAKVGYEKRSGLTGRGPIIFFQSLKMKESLVKIFKTAFPLKCYGYLDKIQEDEFETIIYTFTSRIKPWIPSYIDNINEMIGNFDESIMNIFDFVNRAGTHPSTEDEA
jgi:energy-coupling factor transporter ATP-binding protein EcfA2